MNLFGILLKAPLPHRIKRVQTTQKEREKKKEPNMKWKIMIHAIHILCMTHWKQPKEKTKTKNKPTINHFCTWIFFLLSFTNQLIRNYRNGGLYISYLKKKKLKWTHIDKEIAQRDRERARNDDEIYQNILFLILSDEWFVFTSRFCTRWLLDNLFLWRSYLSKFNIKKVLCVVFFSFFFFFECVCVLLSRSVTRALQEVVYYFFYYFLFCF